MPKFSVFTQRESLVANSCGKVCVAKVEFTWGTKGLASQFHQVQYQIAVVGLCGRVKVTNPCGCFFHQTAACGLRRIHHVDIPVYQFFLKAAGGTEIQQHHFSGFRVVAVVCKVGVGLHQLHAQQFLEQQFKHGGGNFVACWLCGMGHLFNGHAFYIAHGQNTACGQA